MLEDADELRIAQRVTEPANTWSFPSRNSPGWSGSRRMRSARWRPATDRSALPCYRRWPRRLDAAWSSSRRRVGRRGRRTDEVSRARRGDALGAGHGRAAAVRHLSAVALRGRLGLIEAVRRARLKGAKKAEQIHRMLEVRQRIVSTHLRVDVFDALAWLDVRVVFKPLTDFSEPISAVIIPA